jgi:transcriptional regulator with XRE-family HTH domain
MGDETITPRDNVNYPKSEFEGSQIVGSIDGMQGNPEYPYYEQGRRLRWLRLAERISTGTAFAAQFKWPQSGMSQFETGKRQVPRDKVLQLAAQIPGFDPLWLWEGDKRGLSFDLRRRIEEQEAKETEQSSLTSHKR